MHRTWNTLSRSAVICAENFKNPWSQRHHVPCAQTVQYIQPQHHERLGQAELLVIDEAAAIPLPIVKAMLGPYLVFLCSTVNGCVLHTPLGADSLLPHLVKFCLASIIRGKDY